MLPSFLITFREVIEASLIVATILGILTKLGQKKEIKTVWIATGTAAITSILLLFLGSIAGFKVQQIYSGRTEQLIEGILMTVSAVFITWAVFFLHNYFGKYKTTLLARLRATVQREEQRGLFVLVFTAVFREGFEIVLFLSTIYFSSNPVQILGGFGLGSIAALLVCFGLFAATLRMPVFYAFRVTSALLILFAAGLLSGGVRKLVQAGLLLEINGVHQSLYGIYTVFMAWWVFGRQSSSKPNQAFGSDH